MSNHTIKILPHYRHIEVANDSNLLGSLIEHSIFLRADCGGKGRCGKCLVTMHHLDGTTNKIAACRHKVVEDISILVPEASMLSTYIINKAPATLPTIFPQSFANRSVLSSSYGVAPYQPGFFKDQSVRTIQLGFDHKQSVSSV